MYGNGMWSLSKKNLGRRLRMGGDLRLSVVTQALLFALIFLTSVFAELPLFERLSFEARSAPLLTAMIAAFLISYLHSFLLRRRSRELAVYGTLGMGALRCAGIYFFEQLLAGLLCLGIGLLLALPLIWLLLVLLQAAVGSGTPVLLDSAGFFTALGETLLYFAGIFFVSLLFWAAKVFRGSVNGRLQLSHSNETPLYEKSVRRRLVLSLVCFLGAAGMLCYAAADRGSVPLLLCSTLLSPVLLVGIFAFYSGAYSQLFLWRLRRPSLFYKGSRLIKAGAICAACKKNARLSGAVCVCFLTAMACCVTGTLFLADSPTLEEVVMGTAQIVLCVLFLLAAMVILGVRNRTEAWERERQLPLLSQLGMEREERSRLGWFWTVVRFGAPLVVLVPLTAVGAPLLAVCLEGAALAQGFLLYCGVLLFLFLLYALSTRERDQAEGGGSQDAV